MTQELAKRTALVTGGASGIGAAIARAFVRAGAKVVIADVNSDLGESLVAELGDSDATFEQLDVRSSEQIEQVVSRTVERLGRLDIVSNNAGIGLSALLTDHSYEQIDELIAINLRGLILVCRSALPHLVGNPRGGVILNMASNGGVIGRPSDPVYCATKHGVVGITKSLALAHAHDDVRVNALCPGPIDTPMLWKSFEDGTDRETALRKLVATCPDARVASPDEVAAAAVFLASDSARFINGIALPIDGAKAAGVMTADRYRLDFPLSTMPDDPAVTAVNAGMSEVT
jgi:NAD(P)-dependent dehydrogenase (short-subunit alcohol dehydrogenase family)